MIQLIVDVPAEVMTSLRKWMKRKRISLRNSLIQANDIDEICRREAGIDGEVVVDSSNGKLHKRIVSAS